jgi:hypothetical protein
MVWADAAQIKSLSISVIPGRRSKVASPESSVLGHHCGSGFAQKRLPE